MKSFQQAVDNAECAFQEKGGKKPRKLLLGAKEQDYMDNLFIENLGVAPGYMPGSRAEYRGMKVYAVDDESYIGVAE